MKTLLAQSLVVICCLGLTRCASVPQPKKRVINPLAERVSALEMDLKDQNREIARLHSVIQQLTKKSLTPSGSEKLVTQEKTKMKEVPKIKIKPQVDEEASVVSPLMEDVETIVDSSQDSMHTYYSGLQFYNDKHYEEAIDAFGVFVNENSSHVYADRAQFLILDSYFRLKDYRMVVVAANVLEGKYPYSLKMPEASYKKGIALVEMNQLAQAKTTLNYLIKNFPKDPVAELARKKWAELARNSVSRIQ